MYATSTFKSMRLPILNASLLALVVLLLIGGCASSRNAAQAVSGTWRYIVHDTPEGDVGGELHLNGSGDVLAGEITSELTSGPAQLQQVGLVDQVLSFSATVNIDGQRIDTATTATLAGDSMDGTIDVVGVGRYRFTATRAGS